MIATYSPQLSILVFGGHKIGGFADGSMIEVERSEDAYSMNVGAKGDVARVHSLNRTGMITVHLQQSSPSNDFLSAIALLDDPESGGAPGRGVRSILYQELNGTTIANAASAWIKKIPKIDRAKEFSGVDWIFECAFLRKHVGSLIAL